jgi:hypothetical protein
VIGFIRANESYGFSGFGVDGFKPRSGSPRSLLFFCTPVHRSAQACNDFTSYVPVQLPQHFPSPEVMGSAVSAWSCGLIIFIEHRMCVREPVHGMQGVLERLLNSGNDLHHDVL